MNTAPPASREPLVNHQDDTRVGLHEDAESELAKLTDGHGEPLRLGDQLTTLAADLTRSLVTAGFVIHRCASHDRTGGVCLTTSSRPHGALLTWTTHEALAAGGGHIREHSDVQDVMNIALAEVVTALGWNVQAFGDAGAHIVTGHHSTRAATP